MKTRILILLVALAAMLLAASAASAKTVELVAPTGESFDGAGTTAGAFTGQIDELAFNPGTQTILVMDRIGVVSKINTGGVATNFSAIGKSSIETEAGGVPALAIDAGNGNFYTAPESGKLRAWAASGTEILGNFPLTGLGTICGAAVDPQGDLWTSDYSGQKLIEFTSSGAPTGAEVSTPNPCRFAIDTEGYFYANEWSQGLRKYAPDGTLIGVLDPDPTNTVTIDRSNNDVYVNHGSHVDIYDKTGAPVTSFGEPEGLYPGLGGSQGIAVNSTGGETKIYVSNPSATGGPRVEVFAPTGPITVPNVTTDAPTVAPTSAILRGRVNPDGVDTTDCFFQWGVTTSYGNTVPCAEGKVFKGEADQAVTAELTGLQQGKTYHYRLVALNESNVPSAGANREFKPQGPPVIVDPYVNEVNTDGARLNGKINPNGGFTKYKVEWGVEDCEVSTCTSTAVQELASNTTVAPVSLQLSGLTPGTAYHFRLVATNDNGTTTGADNEFQTFPSASTDPDTCANSHVRQQTGAGLLLDCRAYELVSAANTGGYDVLSDLIPGQTPMPTQPGARDTMLYSLNHGTIPGIAGDPTNFGADPYVAKRGSGSWSTRYVGIPANGTPDKDPFSSEVIGSSSGLADFAFGGPDICDPCFGGGTGIPIRLADGTLTQGMAGSLPGSTVAAGYVARHFSADGSHFVFGSASKFEPAGNAGSVTIYDRNLKTGVTQVASTLASGATMTGEVGQLDVSGDGSRILVGRQVGVPDADGNRHWLPYMHVGNSANSVEIAPGATTGVLYAGMTADGGTVYFTTRDKLLDTDTDTDADLYRSTIDGAGADLELLSYGNSGACNPAGNPGGPHWNSVDATADCSVVAFAGGAGVAAGDGTAYFLSPETTEGGEGESNMPNLYVVRPGGEAKFVATLESDSPAVRNATENNATHSYADFQVTASGDFAAFTTSNSPTGFQNLGFDEVFRYDATGSESLDCASCATTGAAPTSDTRLAPTGLNLTDNGRVFFTTGEALVLRDTNGRKDAYQWKDGVIQVVSTGASSADSGLVSVSPDGVNAFFFTREVLVPEDGNGTTMKIYVARELGGFATLPPPVPCKASDECHGPGTPQPGPMDIGTLKGDGGQHSEGKPKVTCKKNQVKKNGKCVKKKKPKKKPTKSKKGHGR